MRSLGKRSTGRGISPRRNDSRRRHCRSVRVSTLHLHMKSAYVAVVYRNCCSQNASSEHGTRLTDLFIGRYCWAIRAVLTSLDLLLFVVFWFEAIVKIVGLGFYSKATVADASGTRVEVATPTNHLSLCLVTHSVSAIHRDSLVALGAVGWLLCRSLEQAGLVHSPRHLRRFHRLAYRTAPGVLIL